MKKLVVSFLTIVCLSGVSGCTYSVPLYRGERLPSRDSAKLYYASEVEIRAFDSKELIIRGESPDCFEILAGRHSVTVVYLGSGRGEYTYSVNPITVKFYAKPGAQYYIDSELNWVNEQEATWRAWVEDKRTEEIVSE